MRVPYKRLPHYSYEDYCQWKGRWELIDGIPYALAPMPRLEHQAVAGNLHAEFRTAFRKSGCDCKAYQPLDYKVSDHTVVNPDVLVVCAPISKAYLDFKPELVAEILSGSTALKDRHVKFDIYQQNRVPYHLIIDPKLRTVEVYVLKQNSYVQQAVDQKQPFTFIFADCSIDIVLENIWD